MKNAFSLIELTIVLVIIGLIIGGITAGQNLIRAAQLQSVITEKKKYESSVAAFQERYFALPGDMNNATAFWGAAASGTACYTTASTGKETCNGDGDGQIDHLTSGVEYEQFRAWQHLANGGFIEGSFPGVGGSGGVRHSLPGYNIPSTRIGKGAFSVIYLDSQTTGGSGAVWFIHDYKNVFVVGTESSPGNNRNALFTAEEAWNIDKKIDDGKPAFGNTMSVPSTNGNTPNCTDTATGAAEYKLAQSGIVCPLVFNLGF